jgi:hypothetical protein
MRFTATQLVSHRCTIHALWQPQHPLNRADCEKKPMNLNTYQAQTFDEMCTPRLRTRKQPTDLIRTRVPPIALVVYKSSNFAIACPNVRLTIANLGVDRVSIRSSMLNHAKTYSGIEAVNNEK